MLVIGLTGGIGSGKSTVADLFAKHGVPIIDADIIARDVTLPKQPAFEKISAHFGNDILQADGTLNRRKLRTLIFQHEDERRWLENLLHPLIMTKIKQQIDALTAPYCIAVIPLLFEIDPVEFIDRTLLIDTDEPLQVDRVIARDHTEKQQIEAILKSQASRPDRLAKAHDVITNNGTLADLNPEVEKLHQMYLNLGK